MGWNAAGSTATTDASALTSGTLASARQSTAVRNSLIVPARLILNGSGNLQLAKVGEGHYVYNPLADEQVSVGTEPTLTPLGASANTLYYIYLDTGSGALSRSTTTPTTTNGVEHITGDTGQILVGWAYALSGPSWIDSGANRLVCSKFNPRRKTAKASGADQSGIATNNTWTSASTDVLISLLKHPDHAVRYAGVMTLSHDSATQETRAGVDVGLSGTPSEYSSFWRSSGSSNYVSLHPLEAVSEPTGSLVYERARALVWGSNAGSTDTMSITSGASANYLRAELMG